LTVLEAAAYPVPPEWRHEQAVTPCSVAWPAAVGFEECPLRVHRFWIPQRHLGIEDMPDLLSEYFTNPAAFSAHGDVRAADALGWQKSDDFVFHCGGDFLMNRHGDVTSS
jgi:hypothetical protein